MAKDTTKTAVKNGETDEKPMAGTSGDKAPEVGSNEVDLEGTRDAVQQRLDKLSEQNQEGHEKNMKAIEEAHKASSDEEPKVDPKLGREDNGNTPRVNKDGSKSWFPPGVAGAPRA